MYELDREKLDFENWMPSGDAKQVIEEAIEIGVLAPLELQECRLSRSEPIVIGSGELAYKIELVSDKPADSLTMHGKVWLIGGRR